MYDGNKVNTRVRFATGEVQFQRQQKQLVLRRADGIKLNSRRKLVSVFGRRPGNGKRLAVKVG